MDLLLSPLDSEHRPAVSEKPNSLIHSFLRLHSDLVLTSFLSNLDSGQKKKKKNFLFINLLAAHVYEHTVCFN